jgi:hypothetical protein
LERSGTDAQGRGLLLNFSGGGMPSPLAPCTA